MNDKVTRPICVGTVKTTKANGQPEYRLVYDQGEKHPFIKSDGEPVPWWRTSRKEGK